MREQFIEYRAIFCQKCKKTILTCGNAASFYAQKDLTKKLHKEECRGVYEYVTAAED